MLLMFAGWLTGCTAADGANYTLQLTPVVASTQSPFDGLDSIDLVLYPESGDALRVSLGAASSGSTPEVTGLPPLENTRIGVEGYRDDVLAMRGLTEPITASGGTVEADVFVASTETAAWLGALSDGLAYPMLAALGEGRFWLAGGTTNTRNGEPSKGYDSVLTLALAPPDAGLTFATVATLPSYTDADGNSQTDRMGATITPLTAAGTDQGKLLVTGGASAHPLLYNGQSTKSVSLYDPATDTWEELPNSAALDDYRSLHLASENLLGNVVVWGGLGKSTSTGTELPNTVGYYDRAARRFSSVGVADLGSLGAVAADLGQDGTLICGGADVSNSSWTSSSLCTRVRLDGSGLDTFEDLPAGLAGAAMIALSDGRILLTGGATTTSAVDANNVVEARSSAWLYNPQTGHWGSLSASMTTARAGHRMALLADGRVLIVGGAGSFNLFDEVDDAVSCLDLYDPTNGTFEAVNSCDSGDDAGGMPGRAAVPAVAYDPDYGVMIVGGLGADGSAQGGVSLFVPGE